MEDWLNNAYPQREGIERFPPPANATWELRRNDVAKAVRTAGSSAPGPGGLRHEAWKSLKEYGVNVLWGAVQDLARNENKELLEANWLFITFYLYGYKVQEGGSANLKWVQVSERTGYKKPSMWIAVMAGSPAV